MVTTEAGLRSVPHGSGSKCIVGPRDIETGSLTVRTGREPSALALEHGNDARDKDDERHREDESTNEAEGPDPLWHSQIVDATSASVPDAWPEAAGTRWWQRWTNSSMSDRAGTAPQRGGALGLLDLDLDVDAGR